jgi:deoxyribodipyrimidine photo-lyase
MAGAPSIVWFRQDLRLDDNPALAAASELGGPVIPVFIHAPEEEGVWPPGAASRWWLHQSLKSLAAELDRWGSRIVVRRGPTLETLCELVRETAAGSVFWNRRFEPPIVGRDSKIKNLLHADGIAVQSFNGSLLFEPWQITTKQGQPYQVFTPFWKTCRARLVHEKPQPAPSSLPAPEKWPRSMSLEELSLEPKIDWAAGMRTAWQPGSKGAARQLETFLVSAIDEYETGRNIPSTAGTSRLSPHLHFGEISIRRVWHTVVTHAAGLRAADTRKCAEIYLAELGWREFSHHLLYHFPQTTDQPLRAAFEKFPWAADSRLFAAWKTGRTGYPIVDAGMRELWTTG